MGLSDIASSNMNEFSPAQGIRIRLRFLRDLVSFCVTQKLSNQLAELCPEGWERVNTANKKFIESVNQEIGERAFVNNDSKDPEFYILVLLDLLKNIFDYIVLIEHDDFSEIYLGDNLTRELLDLKILTLRISISDYQPPTSVEVFCVEPALLELMTSVDLILTTQNLKLGSRSRHGDRVSKFLGSLKNLKPYLLTSPQGLQLRENSNTKLVRIPNSASDNPTNGCLLQYDYVLVSNKRVIPQILERYRASGSFDKSTFAGRREVTFVPVGSPRIARLREIASKPKATEPIILIAPGAYDYPNSLGHDDRVAMIEALLYQFPSHSLRFQAHPAWMGDERTQDIKKTFQSHPRFHIIDLPIGDRIFDGVVALVTDGSNISYTYSMSMLSPSIIYSKTPMNHSLTVAQDDQSQAELFIFVRDLRQLISSLRKLLNTSLKMRELRAARILKIGANSYDHLEKGSSYLARTIRAIADNRHLPDWDSFKPDYVDKRTAEPVDVIARMIHSGVIDFSAYPNFLESDLDLFDLKTRAVIFYKCVSEHRWHTAIFLHLYLWIIGQVDRYGYSVTKSLVMLGVVRNILGSSDSLTLDVFNRVNQVTKGSPSDYRSFLGPTPSRGELKGDYKPTLSRVNNELMALLDGLGYNWERFWTNMLLDYENGHRLVFWGGGHFALKLLRVFENRGILPERVIDRNPSASPLRLTRYGYLLDGIPKDICHYSNATFFITTPEHADHIESDLRLNYSIDTTRIVNGFRLASSHYDWIIL